MHHENAQDPTNHDAHLHEEIRWGGDGHRTRCLLHEPTIESLPTTTTEWGVLWGTTEPRAEWFPTRHDAIRTAEQWGIRLVSREVTDWREVTP